MRNALHGTGSSLERVRNPQHADAVLEHLARLALDRCVDPWPTKRLALGDGVKSRI